MKFTGFTSGCFGKALLIILCIIIGVVLAIGGEALAVYLALSKDGMVGQVEETVNGLTGTELMQFDEETKAMSLMTWSSALLNAVSDLQGTKIGDLEKVLGMSLISETISEVMGIETELIKASSLDTLGETVSNNLTLNNAREQFGIEFPSDIPLFNNNEFLAQPLSSAFSDLTSYKLCEFINLGEDANAVLKEMQDLKIKDLQGNVADEKIKRLCLCQIIDIDDSSSKILQTLKYSTIESFYTDASKTAYLTKEIVEVIGGVETTRTVELKGLNDSIEELKIADVVDITDDSHVILRKMRDRNLRVNELGGDQLTQIVNETKIGEVLDGEKSAQEPIIQAIWDTEIQNLNAKMSDIELKDVFTSDKLETGALSLIPATTKLTDIPGEVTKVMKDATTATMIGQRLIDADLTSLDGGSIEKEQRAFILNSNVGTMMKGLIDFVADPYTTDFSDPLHPHVAPKYDSISPEQKTVTGGTVMSLSDFVDMYSQYATVTFDGDVTVYINESEDAKFLQTIDEVSVYCIPVFNGVAASQCDIFFTVDGENSADVRLAVYDYVYSEEDSKWLPSEMSGKQKQYAYAYFKDVSSISGAFATIGEVTTTQLKGA